MKLQIEKIVYTGDGLGHDSAGTTVFVPFTLTGETVLLDAAGMQVIEPSVDRVAPGCIHFGTCGGCQYQHMNYSAQIATKTSILHETLEATGIIATPELKVHTAEPWHYRNRIRLRIAPVDGVLRLGYNRRGSFEMLPIMECPIAAPLLMQSAATVLELVAKDDAWSRKITGAELFTNSDQSKLQVIFFVRSDRALILSTLCEHLKSQIPQLLGAGVTIVGDSGRKEQPGAQWGAAGLMYGAAERDYWVSRGGFFQVNRFLVDELVQLATAGRSGTLAWDLYAGVGLFSRVLTETFSRVIGVETIVGDLSAVLKSDAVGATAADFLRNAVLQRERPDLIVMDPPRAGLGEEVCDLLVRIKAPQMVYVSCDPQTLARDLKTMVDSGYTIQSLHLIDLFPQTFHMETVVVLNR
jgi:23S rRNA (uracil1939-C5)-methyltransferase